MLSSLHCKTWKYKNWPYILTRKSRLVPTEVFQQDGATKTIEHGERLGFTSSHQGASYHLAFIKCAFHPSQPRLNILSFWQISVLWRARKLGVSFTIIVTRFQINYHQTSNERNFLFKNIHFKFINKILYITRQAVSSSCEIPDILRLITMEKCTHMLRSDHREMRNY